MTSPLRVQAALRHEEPDRVPIDFGGRHTIHVDAHRALKKHLGFEGGAEKVEREVERRIADLAPGGGYVFGSIHNIAAGVPPENVVAMFRAAQKHGGYR
jgi:uroporphyrinogen decarboxylase